MVHVRLRRAAHAYQKAYARHQEAYIRLMAQPCEKSLPGGGERVAAPQGRVQTGPAEKLRSIE